jgi:hypothetical protein
MKKILILIFFTTLINGIKAQQNPSINSNMVAYYMLNKDSICPLLMGNIFKVKNTKGETIEDFAKRKLKKKYNEIFPPTDSQKLNAAKMEDLAKSGKLRSIMMAFKSEFIDDKDFKRRFIVAWNNSHIVFNEVICTKTEYIKLFEKTVEQNRMFFSFLMLPFIADAYNFNIDL